MKKTNRVIWGIVLIAAGVVFALNATGVTDINIFFDGWWTLFIIVPCAVGLFKGRDVQGNVGGLIVGVILLLCCQNVFDFSILWKILLPAFIILAGVKMIFTGVTGKKEPEFVKNFRHNSQNAQSGNAVFCGTELDFSGQTFEGAKLRALFGGVDCDLRNAIIEKDAVVDVSVLFGGVDIFVPANVNVQVTANCIFGGISQRKNTNVDAPTLYITGSCMFGGVDVK